MWEVEGPLREEANHSHSAIDCVMEPDHRVRYVTAYDLNAPLGARLARNGAADRQPVPLECEPRIPMVYLPAAGDMGVLADDRISPLGEATWQEVIR